MLTSNKKVVPHPRIIWSIYICSILVFQIAEIENFTQSWKSVNREVFFVVDALESARCVLDNHLIHLDNHDKQH